MFIQAFQKHNTIIVIYITVDSRKELTCTTRVTRARWKWQEILDFLSQLLKCRKILSDVLVPFPKSSNLFLKIRYDKNVAPVIKIMKLIPYLLR